VAADGAAGLAPAGAPQRQPISLTAVSGEMLILYPNEPRPSYADQLLAVLKDHDVHPGSTREVRELQTVEA